MVNITMKNNEDIKIIKDRQRTKLEEIELEGLRIISNVYGNNYSEAREKAYTLFLNFTKEVRKKVNDEIPGEAD